MLSTEIVQLLRPIDMAIPLPITKSNFILVCTTTSPLLPHAFNISETVIVLGKRKPCLAQAFENKIV